MSSVGHLSKAGELDDIQYVTSNGAPNDKPYSSQQLRVGDNPVGGRLLLQDFHLIESLSHFNRERIPERVVHAKGAGAHGYFEATEDISWLSCASLFEKGTRSPVTVRFSTTLGETGSADTIRDIRGFAIKIRTSQGILDWVFNHLPIFPLRDPAKFPNFQHSQRREPQTHRHSPLTAWDYFSSNPESVHALMMTLGDRGIPKSLAMQNGYSGHTFKFVNANGHWHYVKIHVMSDQGIEYYNQKESETLAGTSPDVLSQELYNRIEEGSAPTWTVSVQVMTERQAARFEHSVFDVTKTWPLGEYPRRTIGRLVLDRNPTNFFAEIEQAAFAPSHLVPGIEPSADPVLQIRLFAYPDAQRYRLGVNNAQIPVNAPLKPVANFQRDGLMTVNNNQGNRPNYPSTIRPLEYNSVNLTGISTAEHEAVDAAAEINNFVTTFDPELDTKQPRDLWVRVFDDGAKERFIDNAAGALGAVTDRVIVKRQLRIFRLVHEDIADRLAKKLGFSDLPQSQREGGGGGSPASKPNMQRECCSPL